MTGLTRSRTSRSWARTTLAGVAAVVGCVSAAAARPGPDAKPSDLADTITYGTSSGSGIFAYDIGTVTCNAGNMDLAWNGSTEAHPVMALNVYRLKAGRFEHVGMSWAKHAFYAAPEAGCGFLCNGEGGTALGVGCSDPYTGGSNGIQYFLGPRSEINATTGAFVYDSNTPNTWPPFSTNIARRIQIPVADVNPALNAGAIYIGETVYASAADAAAGNASNNASYRRIAFGTDATYSSTFIGMPATRVGEAGVLGWSEFDASVKVVPIDIPGDGRFWIAQKVSDNGNGTWHYEFAVENVSSHRSGGSFRVPFAPGTVITNAEFRSLSYHSGEVYTNTAWTISTAGNAVTMSSPQTFAQNPNTNALRWATLHNYRFDANQPPAPGVLTLGLFKPGSAPWAGITSATARMLTPGGASDSVVAPVNDACSSALAGHAGQQAFSTLGAGSSGPSVCNELGSTDLLADVWYTYTYNDTCAGTITFSTCGSDFDSRLAVYSGSSCGPLGSLLGCNDDAAGGSCAGSTAHSYISIAGSPGATYLVRIGSRTGAVGHGLLTIEVPRCVPPPGACCFEDGSCFLAEGEPSCLNQNGSSYLGSFTTCTPNTCPQPPRPPNDACADAIALADINTPGSGGAIVRGTTVWALPPAPFGDNTGCGVLANYDVWFRYTPASSGAVTIDLCDWQSGDMTNPAMELRSGSCAGPIVLCQDDGGCGPNGFMPSISHSLSAGVTYYIRVFPGVSQADTFGIKVSGGGGTLHGACCAGASCSLALPANCTGSARKFVGTGAACNAPGNALTPCCRADFNQNGTITIQDLFDFLAAYFATNPNADFNGSGTVSIQDLFSYLAAWFAKGC